MHIFFAASFIYSLLTLFLQNNRFADMDYVPSDVLSQVVFPMLCAADVAAVTFTNKAESVLLVQVQRNSRRPTAWGSPPSPTLSNRRLYEVVSKMLSDAVKLLLESLGCSYIVDLLREVNYSSNTPGGVMFHGAWKTRWYDNVLLVLLLVDGGS